MMTALGLFLIGLSFGSLCVPAVSEDFRIPLRPYCATLAVLVFTGGVLIIMGRV